VRVFVSYARDDAKHLGRFQDHASSLAEDGIDIFVDTQISGGERWRDQLSAHLDAADIFVALLTAKYVNSKFCQDELRLALQRQSRGECIVLPVNVGPVDLGEKHPLRDIQHVPEGKVISRRGAGQDAAWAEVTRALRGTADRCRKERPRQSSVREYDMANDKRVSSNLPDIDKPDNVTSLGQYRRGRDASISPRGYQRTWGSEGADIEEPQIPADLGVFINALRSARFDSSNWRAMSSRTSRLRKEVARLRAMHLELPERVDILVDELARTLAAASEESADTRTVRSAAVRCDQIRGWLLHLVTNP
jgi:TIR domain